MSRLHLHVASPPLQIRRVLFGHSSLIKERERGLVIVSYLLWAQRVSQSMCQWPLMKGQDRGLDGSMSGLPLAHSATGRREEPTCRLFTPEYTQNMNTRLLIKELHSARNIVHFCFCDIRFSASPPLKVLLVRGLAKGM